MRRIPTILGLVAVLSLTACGSGGGPTGSNTQTLRMEVTSSGKSISWTGSVTPPQGAAVNLSGMTPFSQDLAIQRCDVTTAGRCYGSASVTAGPGPEILTLCLTFLETGERLCISSKESLQFDNGRTAALLLVQF